MLSLTCGLDSHDRKGEAFHVQESIHHEILLVIDEALAQLLDHFFVRIFLFYQLDVLAGCNLSLADDALLILHNTGFMVVDKGVILANFANHIINLLVSGK